tara:strand:+ start:1223 stop:2203 length:981 start_codon:yes stop_codon:yes gene_type:complete
MTSFFKKIKIKKQEKAIKRQSLSIASSIHKMRSIEKQMNKRFLDNKKLQYYTQIVKENNDVINLGLSSLIASIEEHNKLLKSTKYQSLSYYPLFMKEDFFYSKIIQLTNEDESFGSNSSEKLEYFINYFNYIHEVTENYLKEHHLEVNYNQFVVTTNNSSFLEKERKLYLELKADQLKKEKQILFLKHFSHKELEEITSRWNKVIDYKQSIVLKCFEDLISDLESHLFFCKDLFKLSDNLDDTTYINFCLDIINILLNHFGVKSRGYFNEDFNFEKFNFVSINVLDNDGNDKDILKTLPEKCKKLLKDINYSNNSVYININSKAIN